MRFDSLELGACIRIATLLQSLFGGFTVIAIKQHKFGGANLERGSMCPLAIKWLSSHYVAMSEHFD